MSAEIIKLSDHRKPRPQPVQDAVEFSLAMFAAYLLVGAAIYGAIFGTSNRR